MADDELYLSDGIVQTKDRWETWYEADLPMHNPVMRYRFMLLRPGGAFDWLNATGIHGWEVPDSADFKVTVYGSAPQWSRQGAVYQILPDRFARSAQAADNPSPAWAVPKAWGEPPSPGGAVSMPEYYGGDLAGIGQHLDHVTALGATTLYLTPFFPAGSAHRYDATSFQRVDPALGGDQALVELSSQVHQAGLRLVGDLTTNHTGNRHEWFLSAQANASAAEAGFYLWRSHPGDYVGWWESKTLPKLDWRSTELRHRFVQGPGSVVAKWLAPPYSLDGWRIDVANMTGRYHEVDLNAEVARAIRQTVVATRRDGLLVAEHMHDASADLRGDGWQAAMNYQGFMKPVWCWTAAPGNQTNFFGLPVVVPRRPGSAMVRAMRAYAALLPWQVFSFMWNNLGSHDTVRYLTLTGDRDQVMASAVLLATYPGVPMIFAGDEWGATGINGEHGRVAMPWNDPSRQDSELFAAYSAALGLRTRHPALVRGGLRWVLVQDDAVAFLRETADERLLVLISRAEWAGAELSPEISRLGQPRKLLGPSDAVRSGSRVQLPTCGPAAHVWVL
jgi:alpha-glucosidase